MQSSEGWRWAGTGTAAAIGWVKFNRRRQSRASPEESWCVGVLGKSSSWTSPARSPAQPLTIVRPSYRRFPLFAPLPWRPYSSAKGPRSGPSTVSPAAEWEGRGRLTLARCTTGGWSVPSE